MSSLHPVSAPPLLTVFTLLFALHYQPGVGLQRLAVHPKREPAARQRHDRLCRWRDCARGRRPLRLLGCASHRPKDGALCQRRRNVFSRPQRGAGRARVVRVARVVRILVGAGMARLAAPVMGEDEGRFGVGCIRQCWLVLSGDGHRVLTDVACRLVVFYLLFSWRTVFCCGRAGLGLYVWQSLCPLRSGTSLDCLD